MTPETRARLLAESPVHAIEALAEIDALRNMLEKNTVGGYPQDIDEGSCSLCKSPFFDDIDFEYLDKPSAHKPDCAWRLARELLNPLVKVSA